MGVAGVAGANGENGVAGANGSGVTGVEFKGHRGSCKEGGTELASAAGTTLVCNGTEGEEGTPGKQGSPWTAGGTLPSGSTETGAWGSYLPSGEETHALSAISFSIALAVASKGMEYVEEGTTVAGKCEGTAAEPTAAKGYLCVYEGAANEATEVVPFIHSATNSAIPGKTGALVLLVNEGTVGSETFIGGSWAVTAE